MAQGLIAWDTTKNKTKRTTVDPSAIPTMRANVVTVPISSTSIAVTFSSAMPSASYAPYCNLINTTDGSVQFQPITVTAQSTTGFTASWNVATNTANYKLAYQVSSYV